jgi:hypothetical protein
MADGADRIVAQVGLDLGTEVEAVVAAPVARYRSELAAASRNDFDAFLQLPEVALTEVPGEEDPAGSPHGEGAAP